MPDLHFQVEGVAPHQPAVVPQLAFRVRISESHTPATPIHSIVLRCQVRIRPARRRYGEGEQHRLHDLFGPPERWGQTVRDMLWTHVSTVVTAFAGVTVVDLPIPCSMDFNLAATRYFGALEEGEVPLGFLFSGTVFYEGDAGLQAEPIGWEKESSYRLPAMAWHELMERHYPEGVWLCLRRDVFDRLREYRSDHGLASWEQALEQLLAAAERAVPS